MISLRSSVPLSSFAPLSRPAPPSPSVPVPTPAAPAHPRSPQRACLIVGLVSALLYLSGFGSALFLCPYAWLLTVYTRKALPLSVGASAVIIGATRLAQSASIGVVFTEFLVIGSLVLALVMLYEPLHPRLRSVRGLYRLLMVVALFMVITLPLIYAAIQDPQLAEGLSAALKGGLRDILRSSAEEGGATGDGELQRIVTVALRTLAGGYVSIYFLLPVVSRWLIHVLQVLSPRLFRHNVGRHYPLERFRLPHATVWPFIAVAIALLICINFPLSIPFYLFTNVLAVLILLYAMQGVSLLMLLGMRRYSRLHMTRAFLIIILLALFIPFLNGIIIITAFALGISETWVGYDRFSARNADE